jgi:DNA-binding MarR family transcriptional regulator
LDDTGATCPEDEPAELPVRLRSLIGRLARRLRSTEAGAGLTPTQRSVLFAVVRSSPVGLSELADREGLNPTMLSRVIASLADAGLVRRLLDPSDRRVALAEATAEGRRLRDSMRRERSDVLAAHLTGLSAAQRQTIEAALPALEALVESLGSSSVTRPGGGRR